MLFFIDMWEFLSNPAIMAFLGALLMFVGGRALNIAVARKTNLEGTFLTAETVNQLSHTIYTLRNSLNDTENEKSKLKISYDNYKEGCEDLKICVKTFFDNTDTIYKGVGDSLINEQVESLKRKVSK